MSEYSLTVDDLVRLFAGDLTIIGRFRGYSQSEITAIAERLAPDRLTVTAEALRHVLEGLLERRTSAEDAQTWASFIKRGYVSTKEKPLRRVLTSYQAERENEIVEALSRLDELGDPVDGTIDDSELQDLIKRLA
jgi:DNA-binding MarR family transcriptional regulator